MSVQKKSLISQRSAVKSAILATSQTSDFTPATSGRSPSGNPSGSPSGSPRSHSSESEGRDKGSRKGRRSSQGERAVILAGWGNVNSRDTVKRGCRILQPLYIYWSFARLNLARNLLPQPSAHQVPGKTPGKLGDTAMARQDLGAPSHSLS